MSFLAAERLIWLWVALPVIVFYILKARLRKRRVSTLLFWDQIFDEKRQRSLWQNLRHWLSLLLQLLFIALLVFALIDPISRAQQKSGQELILIVDNSASMQAVDADSGKTRLQLAKEEANKLAQGLRAGDSASVMSAGSRVQVVCGMTDFGPTVQEAIDSIPSTDGPTQIQAAIDAARRMSTDADRRRIVVLSDACGQFESKAKTAEDGKKSATASDKNSKATGDDVDADNPSNDNKEPGQDVYWVQVGTDSENVAITLFQARRSTVDPLGYALLVEVQNYSDSKMEGRLKLELDGSLVDVLPYELEADETFRRTVQATSQTGGILTGTLNSEDGLLVDNVAQAVVPKRPTLPVTLVKNADEDCYYLKNVLDSVPLLQITEVSLEEYNSTATAPADASADAKATGNTEAANDSDQNSAKKTGSAGLTVFCSVVPDRMPSGPVLFVSPQASGPAIKTEAGEAAAWTIGDNIESALIAKQADDAALLLHVKMQNVLVMGARNIDIAENWHPTASLLQTAEDAIAMVSVERESGRILILSADLDTSDLPLRIAFPVMMTNAVNWFLRQSNEIHPAIHTGQPSTLKWEQSTLEEARQLLLVAPDGHRNPVAVKNSHVTADALDSTGIYCLTSAENKELKLLEEAKPSNGSESSDDDAKTQPEILFERSPKQSQLIAVNLCSAAESDLRLPKLPDQSDRQIPASGWPGWLWAVFIASGLIVLEWGLFHRRIVA